MKIIIILSVVLAGCLKAPTPEQFKEASAWCKDFGGVKMITYGGASGLRARCNDSKIIIDDSSE